MGLRDIAILVTVYGSIPYIYLKPFIGVLVWYWLGLMNPHRISWTLQNQHFAQIIALVLLFSMLVYKKEKKEIPWTPITITLAMFTVWMFLTTVFSLFPDRAWHLWDKVWKIMLTTYVAMLLLNSKERVIALTFVSAMSMAYFGIKGGYFTIITGGGYRVWGPPGSFIGGNNELGLALIMTVPLLMFFRSIATYRSLRLGFLVSTVLCVFAILGTQSRGALVGILVMGTFLALKSKKKAQYILLALVVGAAGYNFMPETWHERMSTITEYQTDGSAMGRIMAWRMAFNLAMHRPLGGGFQTFRPSVYLMYLPEVGARRTDAHSVYFELMAEHGFIGLGLFLVLGISTFLTCGKIARRTRRSPDDAWMNELARMLQVSFVGYAAAGAFLGLAYFNYLYALVAIVVGLRVVAEKQGALHVVERAGKWGSPATLPRAETARGFGPSHPAGVPAKPVDTLPWLPTRTELIQHAKRWYERM